MKSTLHKTCINLIMVRCALQLSEISAFILPMYYYCLQNFARVSESNQSTHAQNARGRTLNSHEKNIVQKFLQCGMKSTLYQESTKVEEKKKGQLLHASVGK